jgi:multiple sugar transport system ATP-binding protein
MAQVTFQNVTKKFGSTVAVDELSLEVHDGEFLVLLGPSGCGKSTALRMVAGLETVTSGEILIGEDVVNDVPARHRDIAMVFQSYALYPHLTVRKNVEFPLKTRKIDPAELDQRVNQALSTLELTELAHRKPGELSGGQRQRVALARAIVRVPRVFLMDEPLSNLDATLRLQTRADIVELQRNLGTTMIYVTHDQVEAMTMGHRIAVLSEGRLQQVGPPTELYDKPGNAFVARFLGAPGMNLLSASISGGRVRVGDGTLGPTHRADAGAVFAGARAEDLRFTDDGVRAKVVVVEDLGSEKLVVADTEAGERVVVKLRGSQAKPASGETVKIGTDSSRLHFYDSTTGERWP